MKVTGYTLKHLKNEGVNHTFFEIVSQFYKSLQYYAPL